MNTRTIANHLFNYARFLSAESDRYSAIWEVAGDDATAQRARDLNATAVEVRAMAAELYDMKKEVVKK